MKRMLNLLALTALSTSALPTVSIALNTSVVKNLSLKDNLKSVNDNPFISKINEISNTITSTAVSMTDGTIWVGTRNTDNTKQFI